MRLNLPSVNSLFKDAITTAKRFPLVLLSAIAGSAVTIHYFDAIDTYYKADQYEYLVRIILTCTLGLTLFFSINLIAERKIIPVNRFILELAGVAILVAYYFLLFKNFDLISTTRFVLLNITLHLLTAFAPFIGKREPNGFWQYNKIVFLAILTSLLYTYVLYTGLVIALIAIDNLFNVTIEGALYRNIFIILQGVFNTWFFLSRIPKDFNELNNSSSYPKGLKIFTQYVLLPLVTLYLLILYGYEFKIVFGWNLPNGWVSYLVLCFSILGILSLLLIYPVRNNKENKWILTFSKGFYIALFPLILLLFVSIGTRINNYGITEHRYFILTLAIWLAAISLYFLLKKESSIKVIPVSLCLVVFFSGFGPWGAFYVSGKSQLNRLTSILEKNNLLKNGVLITNAKKKIPGADYDQVNSIIDFFDDRKELSVIRPYFSEKTDTSGDKTLTASTLMNLFSASAEPDSNSKVNEATRWGFDLSEQDKTIAIKGYDYYYEYGKYGRDWTTNDTVKIGNEIFTAGISKDKRTLCLVQLPSDSIIVDVVSFFAKSIAKQKFSEDAYNQYPIDSMTVDRENNGLAFKIIFNNISIYKNRNTLELDHCNVKILVKLKALPQ